MAIGVLLAFARQEAVPRLPAPVDGPRTWRSEGCTSCWPVVGPRGTSSPPLAVADAFGADDPTIGITALGTEKGLETAPGARPGLRAAGDPGGAAAAQARRTDLRHAARPGPRGAAPDRAGSWPTSARTSWSASAGTSPCRPTSRPAGRVPVVIHEANARPVWPTGSVPGSPAHVAEAVDWYAPGRPAVGIPLRRDDLHPRSGRSRDEARAALGLAPDGPVLLVFGGSQGAQRINAAVSAALPGLLDLGVQVLHVRRAGQHRRNHRLGPGYHPVAYLDRMDLAYAAADLVVSRSGAMTCAELAAVGLPGDLRALPDRQRRAAAQRPARGQRRRWALVADEDLDGDTAPG